MDPKSKILQKSEDTGAGPFSKDAVSRALQAQKALQQAEQRLVERVTYLSKIEKGVRAVMDFGTTIAFAYEYGEPGFTVSQIKTDLTELLTLMKKDQTVWIPEADKAELASIHSREFDSAHKLWDEIREFALRQVHAKGTVRGQIRELKDHIQELKAEVYYQAHHLLPAPHAVIQEIEVTAKSSLSLF